MVFRSLLYIPYQLCICQVVPFFSVSCQNCFQVVFTIQVMLSQFWPVYNVNVCFSYFPSPMFSDFWEKIKSEWLFKDIPVSFSPRWTFRVSFQQQLGKWMDLHQLTFMCMSHWSPFAASIKMYLHSHQQLMSVVQLIMRYQISPFCTNKYSEGSLTFFIASVFWFNMSVIATCTLRQLSNNVYHMLITERYLIFEVQIYKCEEKILS